MAQKRFRIDRKKPTARGLVGLWGVELTGSSARLVDHSGYRNDATNPGDGVKWLHDFERQHNVMNFDGTADDYWEVPNIGSILDGKAFSFLTWFYPLDAGATSDRIIDRKFTQFSLFWNPDINQLATTLQTTGGQTVKGLDTVVTPGEWQHLAEVWDKDNLLVYINGSLTETQAAFDDGGLANSADIIRIGNRADGAVDRQFEGRMTGTRLYDRVVSGGEVAHIANTTEKDPYRDLRLIRPTRRYVHRHRAEVL